MSEVKARPSVVHQAILNCIDYLKGQYLQQHGKKYSDGSLREGANAIRALKRQLKDYENGKWEGEE